MICEKCGKEFFEDWRKDSETRKIPCRFCSIGCSKSRIKTEEIKSKLRKTLIAFYCKKEKFCQCGKKISLRNKTGYCRICYIKKMKENSKYNKKNGNYFDNRKKNIRHELVKKLGGKCIVCGYDKYEGALDFHHKDPKEKLFGISSNLGKSKQALEEEVNKCVLICSNCHRELHNGLITLKAT